MLSSIKCHPAKKFGAQNWTINLLAGIENERFPSRIGTPTKKTEATWLNDNQQFWPWFARITNGVEEWCTTLTPVFWGIKMPP
jgi:hypothetical protein